MSLFCSKDFTLNVVNLTGNWAYWTFDASAGGWRDSVSNILLPNTGSPGPWISGTGKIGQGITANTEASSDTFSGASGPLTWNPSGTTGFCLWYWVKAPWTSVGNNVLDMQLYAHNGVTFGQLGMETHVGATNSRFNGRSLLGNYSFSRTGTPIADNQWLFGAAQIDLVNNTLTLWDNTTGVLASSTDASAFGGWFPADTMDVVVYSLSSTAGVVAMDEVGMMLDRPLTAAKIAQLYNSGAGVTYPAVKSIVLTP